MLNASNIRFVLFLFILCTSRVALATSDFISFYPKAEAQTQSPPELSSLSILCREKKLWGLGGHVTFAGDIDSKVLLVIFTNKRIEDLTKVITLEPLFLQREEGFPPVPTAYVTNDATLDWAYIYDRNNDGKFDYIAYLFGVLSVKPDDFPSDYPTGGEINDIKQIKLLFNHSRLQFSHYADDNFDGNSDAIVSIVLDPYRYPWVEQYGVLRSKYFDGNIDETWTFKKNITQRTGVVGQKNQKYILQNSPENPLQTGAEWLDFGTSVMKTINEYAEKCGLTERILLNK